MSVKTSSNKKTSEWEFSLGGFDELVLAGASSRGYGRTGWMLPGWTAAPPSALWGDGVVKFRPDRRNAGNSYSIPSAQITGGCSNAIAEQ